MIKAVREGAQMAGAEIVREKERMTGVESQNGKSKQLFMPLTKKEQIS